MCRPWICEQCRRTIKIRSIESNQIEKHQYRHISHSPSLLVRGYSHQDMFHVDWWNLVLIHSDMPYPATFQLHPFKRLSPQTEGTRRQETAYLLGHGHSANLEKPVKRLLRDAAKEPSENKKKKKQKTSRCRTATSHDFSHR